MAVLDEDFGADLTLVEGDGGVRSSPAAEPVRPPRDWQILYEQAPARAERERVRADAAEARAEELRWAEVAARSDPVRGSRASGRAALFTLITRLEMAMAQRIETEWHGEDDTGWLELLSEERRKRIREAINKTKDDDGFVSEIAFSQLSDKATIIRKEQLIPGSGSRLTREFNAIRELRDDIAHANYYAESPKAAAKTCETVRTIVRIKGELSSSIEDRANPL